MFASKVFGRAMLVLAIAVIGFATGCSNQGNPDSQAQANAKSREVAVEITGMS